MSKVAFSSIGAYAFKITDDTGAVYFIPVAVWHSDGKWRHNLMSYAYDGGYGTVEDRDTCDAMFRQLVSDLCETSWLEDVEYATVERLNTEPTKGFYPWGDTERPVPTKTKWEITVDDKGQTGIDGVFPYYKEE